MSGAGGLRYDRYRTGGCDEWLMRIGAGDAPPILFLPPLFEEMNRTRALLADTMRALAADGFGCWLPDLPGAGESERPLEACGWEDWRAATCDAARHIASHSVGPLTMAAIRGGALLDDAAQAACRWRLAPVEGASLARDMARSGLAGGGGTAGYPVSEAMRAALAEAVPASFSPLRTVRLASDPREADNKVDGPALWRRSEPDTSAVLAEAAARDIADWARSCAAS